MWVWLLKFYVKAFFHCRYNFTLTVRKGAMTSTAYTRVYLVPGKVPEVIKILKKDGKLNPEEPLLVYGKTYVSFPHSSSMVCLTF